MKKYIVGSIAFLFLFVAANSTYTEAFASTKKSSCSCKMTKRKVSRAYKAKRQNVAIKGDTYANQNYQSAGVVGPTFATYTLPANEYFRLRMNSTIMCLC